MSVAFAASAVADSAVEVVISPRDESDLIVPNEQSVLLPRSRSTRVEPVRDIVRAEALMLVTDDEMARVQNLNSPNKAGVTAFYEKQNALVGELRELDNPSEGTAAQDAAEEASTQARIAIKASFIANLVVVSCKLAAAISTGSIAVIASTIDSFLDVLSGSILYMTERAMNTVNVHKFPAGKSRLEPVGIVLFAGIMAMAAVQILQQSVSRILSGVSGVPSEVNLGTMSIVLLCSVASIKLVLFLFCRAVSKTGNFPSVEALAQDHLNDVTLDSVSLIAAGLAGAFKDAWFLDPIGGIIVGLIILRSWVKTGREQISCLIGRAAPPEFVSKVTYVAATNSPQILRVDTVRAYHFGVRFVVEVDVVLPEDMPLKQAHDIGEALEERIEMLDDVERAYVHLDYEFDHKPERLPGQGNRHD